MHCQTPSFSQLFPWDLLAGPWAGGRGQQVVPNHLCCPALLHQLHFPDFFLLLGVCIREYKLYQRKPNEKSKKKCAKAVSCRLNVHPPSERSSHCWFSPGSICQTSHAFHTASVPAGNGSQATATDSWQLARLKVTCGATPSSKNSFAMAALLGHEHVWELLAVHWTKTRKLLFERLFSSSPSCEILDHQRCNTPGRQYRFRQKSFRSTRQIYAIRICLRTEISLTKTQIHLQSGTRSFLLHYISITTFLQRI